jgi:ketosteroid isomerase-like protein
VSADDLEYGPVSDLGSAADALKLSFDTGDRGPFEELFGPGCVNWHNSDKAVVPAAGFAGAAALRQLVDDLHADIIQHEVFPGGQMIRIAIRGTVRANGRPLEAHNCVVLSTDATGITRIDDYVDPTFADQVLPPKAS